LGGAAEHVAAAELVARRRSWSRAAELVFLVLSVRVWLQVCLVGGGRRKIRALRKVLCTM